MLTQANWRSADHRVGVGRLTQSVLFAAMLAVAALTLPNVVKADQFVSVLYDAQADELVVTMSYSGTNPDHEFSVQWGDCQTLADASMPEIVGDVTDSQSQDAARQDFKTTTRFSLDDLPCRPVKLTLRTAPKVHYTVQIPARPAPRK